MNKLSKFLAVISLVLTLTVIACNGDFKGGPGQVFLGTWSTNLSFVFDDCGLAENTGIVPSEQSIVADETEGYLVTSTDGLFEKARGELLEGAALQIAQEINSDIFSDGIKCEESIRISYSDLNNSNNLVSASNLLEYRIECPDGFTCVSQAKGTATKK